MDKLLPNQIVNLGADGDTLGDDTNTPVAYHANPTAEGMALAEKQMIAKCMRVLNDRYTNNLRRWNYYLGKNVLNDLGLAFPAGNKIARKIHPVCGWAARAVDMLAARSTLDYFVMPEGVDDTALRAAYEDNDLGGVYQSMLIDELICGVEFMSVTSGIDKWDEGEIFIGTHSAFDAACIWDRRKRRIAYGITISDADDMGNVSTLNLFTDNAIYTYSRDITNGVSEIWTRTETPNPLGRPALEPMMYRPSEHRPLGRSRITESAISTIDNAVREEMRSEVAAETYTAPQRVFLNVDPKKISLNSKGWDNYWHSYVAIGGGTNGQNASALQFNPPGMQDHVLYMRQLAMEFAGEMYLPINAMGIVQDNPSSAEAIFAAQESLVVEAERMNRINGRALRNVALMVMALSQGKRVNELTPEEKSINAKFKAEDRPSRVSAAQAMLEQVQAIPRIAETDVALEELGYDDGQISRMRATWQRTQGTEFIKQLVEKGSPTLQAPTTTIEADKPQAEEQASKDE